MENTAKDKLKNLVSILPNTPGVYQFYNDKDDIIYIGKAKDLKKRVSSYFNRVHDSARTNVMIKKIVDVKHIVVDTEEDALLLENNLIKKYQPRYNVLLKDDKSYPWICIKKEDFSRVFVTRHLERDGSEYFGPYTSTRMVRTLMELISSIYKLRSCRLKLNEKSISESKFKLCLEYHIGNCKAPCVAKQTESDYDESIACIRSILKGNIRSVMLYLKKEMISCAEEMRFEDAQLIKEKYTLLEKYSNKSTIVSPSINNIDVYTIISDDKNAYVNFLKIINGAIVQAHTIELKKKMQETDEHLLVLAIAEIRQKIFSEAKEILIPFAMDLQLQGVSFVVPKIGDKKKILDLSLRNAKYFRQDKIRQELKSMTISKPERIVLGMKKDLRLSELPVHIECFDNSNIQGDFPVAACVVFRNAKPYKKDYRHFNIKTVVGANDYASMEEIIYRRYKRLVAEKQSLPQLVVIDGGKGQLGAALNALDKLNLRGVISVIGIAKRLEEIFFPGDPYPLYLDKNSESLKVIQHLRNEAHRFGITFHRDIRSKAFVKSDLDNITGVGDKTKEKLFAKFETIANIKNASKENIANVIGNAKAQIVRDYFENKNK